MTTNVDIKSEYQPEGLEGQGFFATSLDKAVGLARANSLWPLPFATSCCGIEFMATMASHYDLSRFGMERLSFSPRQADLLMVMGTISKKMAPILYKIDEENSQLSLLKINGNKNTGMTEQLEVTEIPTMILYKNGKQVWRHTGLATEAEIKSKIY
jgi:hypothetical protein